MATVSWLSLDHNGWNIWLRIFDENMKPLGNEFKVNSIPQNTPQEFAVTINDSGNIIVVWTSKQGENYSNIYAKKLDITSLK